MINEETQDIKNGEEMTFDTADVETTIKEKPVKEKSSKAKLTEMATVEARDTREPKEIVNAGNGVTVYRY